MSETITSGHMERHFQGEGIFERAQALLMAGYDRPIPVEGLPARDGHPGLGFRGEPDFMQERLGGKVLLERDPNNEGGMRITLMAKGGEKLGRPFSRKSLPEITGGDTSQQFDALQVRFTNAAAPLTMYGLTIGKEEPEEVRGLYGTSVSATAPDAELFASACLKALERDLAAQAAAGVTTQ